MLLHGRGVHGFLEGLALLGSVRLLDLPARWRWRFLHLLALGPFLWLELLPFLDLRGLLDHGSRLCRLDCRRHRGAWRGNAGWLGTARLDHGCGCWGFRSSNVPGSRSFRR